MEQDFQTSFIPKKPMIVNQGADARPVSFLTIISIFLFFSMLLATGALYFYKGVMAKNLVQMESDLNLAKNRFEPSKIAQLQVLDKRLKASEDILGGHIAVSPIFSALEDITMQTVRYTKFSYTLDAQKKVMVNMSGLAVGYRSIALQSDLFAKKAELIDPVFSNLSLDDNGNVLFDLDFSVDPVFVDYQQVLKNEGTSSTEIPETMEPIGEFTN